MGDLLIGLLGWIPRIQTAVLEMGGIVNLVFKIHIKVPVLLWNDVFCVTTVHVQCSAERVLDVWLWAVLSGVFCFLRLFSRAVLENPTCL